MQIREAKVFNFGKLQNKTITFADGINVIYGDNEAGKSTLEQFLVGMLFGMEKGRGRGSLAEPYTRYEPWHAPSYYSGAIRFQVEDKVFYLERNFYTKEKSDYLRCETDGEELSVSYGDLEMLFGGIGKEAFGNTYHITQSGAVTGSEMQELLTAYLANAASGGDEHMHVGKALKGLQARRKELLQKQKRESEKKESRKAALELEANLLEQDCEKLRQSRRNFAEKISEEPSDEGRNVQKPRIMMAVCAIGAVLLAVGLGMGQVVPPGYAVTFAAVCLAGMAGYAARQRKEQQRKQEWQRKQVLRMLEEIEEPLQEKETRRMNIREQIAELEGETEEALLLQEDIEALALAESELERLSKEYYEEIEDELNAEISRWVSVLTDGAYDRVRLDEEGRLLVLAEQKEVTPQMLSRGTLEQIYFAMRLAVGSVVTREEEMPIFLDEAFAMYDEKRLEQTLRALAESGKQIFLFTCQQREMQVLKKLGVSYQCVFLND